MTRAVQRSAALVAALLLAALLTAAPAQAHPMPTSAVLLDVHHRDITGQIQVPLDRVEFAFNATPAQASSTIRQAFPAYARRHLAATATDGTPWSTRIGAASLESIDGAPHLVMSLRLSPPAGHAVSDFKLHYDVLIDRLITHRAILTERTDFRSGHVGHDAQPVGIFDWSTRVLTVHTHGGSWLRGMIASARLGIQHVSTGADHLLFLLMLLLPAPLIARRGRWQQGPSDRRSAIRVVHVVSAFALGHSITLILAGLGVVHVPERPVEALIAFSIVVSALHAIRPLVARGEVYIAAGFGLVHGLAFASAISGLGLDRGSLISLLFGFNIGIELTQLFVVALIMPSLIVLARTSWYPAFRRGLAGIGLLFAGSWLLERTTLTTTDPFAPLTDWLVAHHLIVAAALALLAVTARATARSQRPAGASSAALLGSPVMSSARGTTH